MEKGEPGDVEEQQSGRREQQETSPPHTHFDSSKPSCFTTNTSIKEGCGVGVGNFKKWIRSGPYGTVNHDCV